MTLLQFNSLCKALNRNKKLHVWIWQLNRRVRHWDFSMLEGLPSSIKQIFSYMQTLCKNASSIYTFRTVVTILFMKVILWQCSLFRTATSRLITILEIITYLPQYLFHLMCMSSNRSKTNVCTHHKTAIRAHPPSRQAALLLFHPNNSNIHQIMSLTHQPLPKLWLFIPKHQSSSREQKTGEHGRFCLSVEKLTLIDLWLAPWPDLYLSC